MTLDEAITHAEEVAEEQEKLCKVNDDFNFSQPRWKECAKEHRQLAKWLMELKEFKSRTGHWIRVDKDKLKCSRCEVIHFIAQYPLGKIDWCPNCGSRNEVVEK